MFIWTAIDVSNQLTDIRQKVAALSVPSNPCLTLPLHISLKISFEVDDCITDEVIEALSRYLESRRLFTVRVAGMEKHQRLVWIAIRPDESLVQLHQDLDRMLMERFGIAQHPFDKAFLFHTSLYMNEAGTHVDEVYDAVMDDTIPEILTAEKYVIGTSSTGEPGTFTVYKTISICRRKEQS